jgi:phosphate transport system substrate-binding protein
MFQLKPIILCLILISGLSCKTSKSYKESSDPGNSTTVELNGTFSVGGAYALYPLAKKWADDFMTLHKGVKIEVISTGTGQGIKDLLGKKIQLAMISRPLTNDEMEEGIWIVPVARDGVAPIVNQKNPYLKRINEHGITPEKLIKLFTGDRQMTWGELLDTNRNEKVIVYTRADESGAAEVWAKFLWKGALDLKGIKVTGDEEMIKNLQSNPLAVGYCNFSYAFDGTSGDRIKDIQVIPIDLDFDHTIDRREVPFGNIAKAHRALWLGYYPENLCRELTFGALGKPSDPAIIEFLKYVLTEGQSKVKTSNFCELNDVYLKYSMETLE